MEKVETGEIIELDNGKEYICFSTLRDDGEDYIFLMSNFKPLEIRFARQYEQDGEILLEIVGDRATKERLLELFKAKHNAQN